MKKLQQINVAHAHDYEYNDLCSLYRHCFPRKNDGTSCCGTQQNITNLQLMHHSQSRFNFPHLHIAKYILIDFCTHMKYYNS